MSPRSTTRCSTRSSTATTALAHDPMLVKRLRRMRATRQRGRGARRLEMPDDKVRSPVARKPTPDDVSRLAATGGAAVGVHRARHPHLDARVRVRDLPAGGAAPSTATSTRRATGRSSSSSGRACPPTATASVDAIRDAVDDPIRVAQPQHHRRAARHPLRLEDHACTTSSKQSGLAGKIRRILLGRRASSRRSPQANWDGAKPPANVVRFEIAEARATPRHLLAKLLDIQTVAFGLTESRPIAVVLVTDPLPDADPTPSSLDLSPSSRPRATARANAPARGVCTRGLRVPESH